MDGKYLAGSLILVNAENPIKSQLHPRALAPVCGDDGSVLMARSAGALLGRLMDEIHGWRSIAPVSGWRSEAEQREIWQSTLKTKGESFTRKYVALPGCSEHQTGLAIDLGLKSDDMDFIRPEFPYSGICSVFRERAAGYGFIERYPSGKEQITGIAHEPWHFRYVGLPHSAIMAEMGLALEEYHELLKQYPHGDRVLRYEHQGRRFEISRLTDLDGLIPPGEDFSRTISGDNTGGFVVTDWKV